MGKSELEVSEVGFGVWTLASGRWGSFTDDQAVDLLHKAYDAGINYFDVSPTDGGGRGERLIGQAFGDKRELVIVSSGRTLGDRNRFLPAVDPEVVGGDPRTIGLLVRRRAPVALSRCIDGRECRRLADPRGVEGGGQDPLLRNRPRPGPRGPRRGTGGDAEARPRLHTGVLQHSRGRTGPQVLPRGPRDQPGDGHPRAPRGRRTRVRCQRDVVPGGRRSPDEGRGVDRTGPQTSDESPVDL